MSEKRAGINELAEISGLSPNRVKTLWAEVQENSAKIHGCEKHRFEGIKGKLGQKMTCLNCGGTMGLIEAGMYVRGYKAAGGDPDDVWPGFFK